MQGLLDSGASPTDIRGDCAAPLHLAAYEGHKDITALLIEHGATVDARAKAGWTALHFAANGNHKEIITLLLIERGADVNAAVPEFLDTPLHEAASSLCVIDGDMFPSHPTDKAKFYAGKSGVVKLLLEKGAKVNAELKGGRTPLDQTDSDAISSLLRRQGGQKSKEKEDRDEDRSE